MCYSPLVALPLSALALSIWFGGGLAMLYATRALFSAASTREEAGHFAGSILRSFRFLQVAAIALWFAASFFKPFGYMRLFATLSALFTAASLPIDARLHQLRALPRDDPRRKPFGPLHGVSVLLLVAQVICAGAGLIFVGQ